MTFQHDKASLQDLQPITPQYAIWWCFRWASLRWLIDSHYESFVRFILYWCLVRSPCTDTPADTASLARGSKSHCLARKKNKFHVNKLFIRVEVEAMMDRIFICATVPPKSWFLIQHHPSLAVGKKKPSERCDVIRWNKQRITAAGPLASCFYLDGLKHECENYSFYIFGVIFSTSPRS